MALSSEDDSFTGKLRLPLPPTFSRKPHDWEEWSWTFKAYLSMCDAQAAAFLDAHELDPLEVTDGDLNVSVVDDQGVTSTDRAATAARVTFSRKLHYLPANLTTDAARLVVRQNYDSNGLETWRRLVKKFALPDATRHVSLLNQLLDFKFNPQTFEQDLLTWETIKVKYEKQTGAALPDSVLVATLLNKTSGALQTHLRLNARTLTTYEEIRTTILEYHQSRHILTGASSSNQGPAPMDMRMRHLKVKNLVIKVGLRMIGPQILGLRTGGLMTWLPLCLVMELGMMIGGGRLGMTFGAMVGLILLGALFRLRLLRKLLLLLRLRLLSQKPLQERQSAQ